MGRYILAHDLGTSGDKAILFDEKGSLLACAVAGYKTYENSGGIMEQDPEDWWKAFCITTKEILEKSGIAPSQIEAVSFSGQMMGCLPVDFSGNPLYKSIIWADSRAEKQESFIKSQIEELDFYRITGHRISAYYSAAKILWLKENRKEIYERTYKFLQTKDYLVMKLTGQFITDYSDACGTNLFNLEKKEWSEEICNKIGLDIKKLPKAFPSTKIAGNILGNAAHDAGLDPSTIVVIGGGDGSCAAVGACSVEPGDIYNVLGTSSWTATVNTKPIYDREMRTFNWVHLNPELYSPCGTMQAAGYSYQWAKKNLCQIESNEEFNKRVEASQPGAGNLIYLPYLLGERSPIWNINARGAFIGLSGTHKNNDMCRAVLEGVVFNLKIITDLVEGSKTNKPLVAIGGALKGKVWSSIMSEIFHREILLLKYPEEAGAIGAAVCAGVAAGIFEDFSIAKKINPVVKTVKSCEENREKYNKLFEIFQNSYNSLIGVYEQLNRI